MSPELITCHTLPSHLQSSSSSQATPSPFGGAFSSTTAPNAFTNANANTTASAPVQFGGSAAFGGAKNAF
ncbi:hypothetical protein SARC_17590, partial [Sphaeroforma arctica JP610]